MQKAIIIGAGIAGIATSIRLAVKGYDVTVYEANSYPGGKLTSFYTHGFRFDAGPSLFTLPHLVTELFSLCGEDVSEHFTYQKKETICNYFWEDGARFTMPAEKNDIVKEMASHFSVTAASIHNYLESAKRKYELTNSIFIEKSLHKLSTYMSWDTAKALINSYRLDINTSLDGMNRNHFSDPKLVQLFNRYATYNGSSPYKTPGIMSMIPHLEMGIGTYFPDGGMESITNSLVKLAERMKVKFCYNKMVDEIHLDDQQNANGVVVSGKYQSSDVVVSNMDVHSTYNKLLPSIAPNKNQHNQERSSSALIFYWGVEGSFPELDLHNILFSDDYKSEFDHIFELKSLYRDPTIYINVSNKCNPKDAPPGCENWFVMINTPSNTGQDWTEMIKKARQQVIQKIERILNTDLSRKIICEKILDPRSIESKTQSYQGSLYGTASNNKFAAFARHPNFSKRVKNLYFVGGSVHPGGGIPLCLNSAKIVGNLL